MKQSKTTEYIKAMKRNPKYEVGIFCCLVSSRLFNPPSSLKRKSTHQQLWCDYFSSTELEMLPFPFRSSDIQAWFLW